jgi:hypothetical protein
MSFGSNGTRELGRCIRGDGPGGALSGTFAYEPGVTRWTDADAAVTTYEITIAYISFSCERLTRIIRRLLMAHRYL